MSKHYYTQEEVAPLRDAALADGIDAQIVAKLNRFMGDRLVAKTATTPANYFCSGQVIRVFSVVDRMATRQMMPGEDPREYAKATRQSVYLVVRHDGSDPRMGSCFDWVS